MQRNTTCVLSVHVHETPLFVLMCIS